MIADGAGDDEKARTAGETAYALAPVASYAYTIAWYAWRCMSAIGSVTMAVRLPTGVHGSTSDRPGLLPRQSSYRVISTLSEKPRHSMPIWSPVSFT